MKYQLTLANYINNTETGMTIAGNNFVYESACVCTVWLQQNEIKSKAITNNTWARNDEWFNMQSP